MSKIEIKRLEDKINYYKNLNIYENPYEVQEKLTKMLNSISSINKNSNEYEEYDDLIRKASCNFISMEKNGEEDE